MDLGILNGLFGNKKIDNDEEIAAKKHADDLEWIKRNSESYINKDNDRLAFANKVGKNKVTPNQIANKKAMKESVVVKDLLGDAMKAREYNQSNKYRNAGLGLSAETGDNINRITNRLFSGM